MAEGLVSFKFSVHFSMEARSLEHTVLMRVLESLSLLRCFLGSLGSAAFVSLSSFGRDRPLMLLRAPGQSLMRPRRSELRSSNWSLRSLPLMRWLGILISFLFPSWLELPVPSSLFSFREDSVNNGRSNYGVSPVREEDNHLSSGSNEGRLSDDSGSNDVSVRLNSVPDGGCIEERERRAGETPGPSTVISHGTDGLESILQYVMVAFLWQVVDKLGNSGNSGNWERMFEGFDLEDVLRNTPSYSERLEQIKKDVRSEFPRLLQLRERNPSLSLEDLKVYCVLLCWSSNQRVDFWSDLSDELLSRADKLKKLMLEFERTWKKLMLELERTWKLQFGEKRNDRIDDELLSRADELKKLMLEFERTWQPLFGEKRNDKMVDELLSRVDELKKFMLEFKRMWQLHFGEKRNDKADELLSRADELKELRLELERTWQLHFDEKWNDKIDEEWIKEFGEDWRSRLGEKWIDKIDEEWIKKNGKKWIDRKIEEWIEKVDPRYWPHESDYRFVRGLLRFMRNRRHHSDKFQESHGLRSVESLYNYVDALFPDLLMVSYGFSYRFCREEPWFQKYRLKGNLCKSTFGRHAL